MADTLGDMTHRLLTHKVISFLHLTTMPTTQLSQGLLTGASVFWGGVRGCRHRPTQRQHVGHHLRRTTAKFFRERPGKSAAADSLGDDSVTVPCQI